MIDAETESSSNLLTTKETTAVFFCGKKDKATKEFENYLTYCKKRFNCKVHCLHADGGAKYKVVDFFCKRSGVGRQVSEAENQDSNGKAERMHQTMMDMVPSMVFGSGLPLKV